MSKERRGRLGKLVEGIRHAFSTESPHGELTDEDHSLLSRLAAKIVGRKMATPALLFLRSLRPLGYVGGQALAFLRPFLTPLFNKADYDRMTAILERREGVGALIAAIEAAAGDKKGGKAGKDKKAGEQEEEAK